MLNWQSYKNSQRLIDSSSIANNALLSLNLLNDPKIKLNEEQRKRSNNNIVKGLELINSLILLLDGKEKDNEKDEPYAILRNISKGIMNTNRSELKDLLKKAQEEMNNVLQSKLIKLEQSSNVMDMISKTSGSQLQSFSKSIR